MEGFSYDLGPWGDNPLFWVLAIWSLVWKGFALWKASQAKEKWWFIALFVINTFGLLEIFYIFIWTRREVWQKKHAENVKENTQGPGRRSA